jgi:TonB family protein
MRKDVKAVVITLFALVGMAGIVAAQEISHRTPPRVIYKVDPQYTREALAAKVTGVVAISVTVGADGVPTGLRVVKGLGSGLDETAVECVEQWRFAPGTRNGAPEPVKATIEVNFRLPSGQ